MLKYGDHSFVYFSKEDKMVLMINDLHLVTMDRADVPEFLKWLQCKGSTGHFHDMEIMDWLRMDSYVITARLPDHKMCLLYIRKATWEHFIEFIEENYSKLLETVYQPLIELQEKYECSWGEADKRLKEKGSRRLPNPDLPS